MICCTRRSFRFVSRMGLGVIGKHVVWTETSTAISTICNTTRNLTAQTTEDFLHLDDTDPFRPISGPCRRHTIPRVTPGLFHDHHPRHRCVTTYSDRTILGLGVSTRFFVFRPNWLNPRDRRKGHNGRLRTKCCPRCRRSDHKLHEK